MKIYLVGGSVRDKLLGRPVKDRDWVVVGASPEDMLAQNFKPVGKDFPVFLHPETKEEYALARTERKTGHGYTGFSFHADPSVTLEQDLVRRDLTINAIAMTADEQIIDPYHGQQDIEKKVLRHVSPAFAEDPVRILRLARFAARFSEFSVDPETNQLMQTMVANGEVDYLVAERVWQELEKTLTEDKPQRFFAVLADCQALAVIFPEFAETPATLIHFDKACQHSDAPLIRFAGLLQALTDQQIKTLTERLRTPKVYRELGVLTQRCYHTLTQALQLSAEELLTLLQNLDAFRREQRAQLFFATCQALDNSAAMQQALERTTTALEACNNISIESLNQENLQGQDFADALKQLRINAINELL